MQVGRLGWCLRCQRGHQSCCLLLVHPLIGGHVASFSSGNTSTSVCVCVCVCVSPQDRVPVNNGIFQGDPMSVVIFILVANLLVELIT